ncbi:MAG: hypothetical protein AAGL17_17185, partial [Cyanobacteria bacterium J06576_12]
DFAIDWAVAQPAIAQLQQELPQLPIDSKITCERQIHRHCMRISIVKAAHQRQFNSPIAHMPRLSHLCLAKAGKLTVFSNQRNREMSVCLFANLLANSRHNLRKG